ncbi:NADH-quinone oxidoreductase subunit I [bacterium]|nr:NADH-quinone oxidoreductase subunit I [candidate division CSSED10-310 bacterium]
MIKRVRYGWWERLYLLEVLRGLWITNKHFWANIFNRWTKDSATVQYPEQIPVFSPTFRGRHRLTRWPDGKTRCVACMCCSWACPAKCIHITPEDAVAGSAEKHPREFVIDYIRCIWCGLCVEACPYDAIYMDLPIHSVCSYQNSARLDLAALLDDEYIAGTVESHRNLRTW